MDNPQRDEVVIPIGSIRPGWKSVCMAVFISLANDIARDTFVIRVFETTDPLASGAKEFSAKKRRMEPGATC